MFKKFVKSVKAFKDKALSFVGIKPAKKAPAKRKSTKGRKSKR